MRLVKFKDAYDGTALFVNPKFVQAVAVDPDNQGRACIILAGSITTLEEPLPDVLRALAAEVTW